MKDLGQTADRFVKERFGDRAKNLAPLASGDWSSAYSFTLDGRDRVIRFGAYRGDFEKDRAMGAHSMPALPIPKVIEVGETESGFYAVSERVQGTAHLDELDEKGIKTVLPQLLDALYELQKLDLRDTQEVGIWRPAGTGRSWGAELLSVSEPRDRLAGWRERLDASPREAGIFDAGIEKLRLLVPRLPECWGIVHNDLLNRNVLVDEGKLTGVFDWGNAFYGDPLYDHAWFLYWWSWYPQWQGIDLQEILDRHWDSHGGPPEQMQERLLCCLIHIGLDHIAYCAFRERTEDMRRNADQLLTYI
ncbi:phosphotransferase family protein [Paenibacillus sacheonensis]|uniref:Phosphotransferase n=1 Tax=Paenibacillus sacheonensis TaxID=742054 RepID=A0A7X5C4H2_9BACL|nr:phosphotransferase [Paenibacillus sacheonensis]MBM7568556.1 hygromycin-B 4-O-kinase [Paenibacillus sacheonensis]NBC72379.1 phosphotransferase [Paenibacillus sacheonensis]